MLAKTNIIKNSNPFISITHWQCAQCLDVTEMTITDLCDQGYSPVCVNSDCHGRGANLKLSDQDATYLSFACICCASTADSSIADIDSNLTVPACQNDDCEILGGDMNLVDAYVS